MKKRTEVTIPNGGATPTELINLCAALPDDAVIYGLEDIDIDMGNGSRGHFVKHDDTPSESIAAKPVDERPVLNIAPPMFCIPHDKEKDYERRHLTLGMVDQIEVERCANDVVADYLTSIFNLGIRSLLEYQTQARARMTETHLKEMCTAVGMEMPEIDD
jgi:hypothetical protein